ncbi:MAG: lipoyl(octanoyl) transferase LipB [Fimbriimonadaceae bacterium]|nr:lipoyl(octanoyl) transferase LipB [Fimbriimonadaceae bacterium]
MADTLDLGSLGYLAAWEVQKQIADDLKAGVREDTVIFVEHPPVYTLGASFHEENLLFSVEEYERRGIEIVKTDRGGDVTYHGPRQLVIYPIFDLRRHGQDLHKWLRDLEEAMIDVCGSFGLTGVRSSVNTGVWVGEKKIAAIGIKVSKWISLHGIALNCDNDLGPFDWIVPCGITGYGVTSLSQEVGKPVTTEMAKPRVLAAFSHVFGMSFHEAARTHS